MPLEFVRRSSIFGANAVGLLQVAPFVGMIFILTNYLQRAAWLLCAFGWSCISPNGSCISSRFCIFASTIGKSLWCQTNHNFGDGFADNWLSIAFTNLYHRKLLWRIARTNAPHRGWNCVRLHCNQHSCTHRDYERRTRPRLRINQHFSSNRRRNRSCGAVDSCEFQNPAFNSSVCDTTSRSVAMVTGFGYAFLGSRTGHRDRNCFYGFIHTGKR